MERETGCRAAALVVSGMISSLIELSLGYSELHGNLSRGATMIALLPTADGVLFQICIALLLFLDTNYSDR